MSRRLFNIHICRLNVDAITEALMVIVIQELMSS